MEFQNYQKYRWFFTSSNTLVLGGKSALQNDELMIKLKDLPQEFVIMHTSEPGSPFCILFKEKSKVTDTDIEECAVFTGCFSRAWRAGKNTAKVDIFSSSQIHKNPEMKSGTWGVYGKVETMSVSLELAITKQKEVLRAVPISTLKKKDEIIKITPGNIDKNDMFAKLEIELNEPLSKEEVLSALPTGKFKVSRS
ncbi:MAG: NFACT RNA binding domain-containing protein [Nanoarchaeota archaeon]